MPLAYLPDRTVSAVEIDEDGAYRIEATYDLAPDACLLCGRGDPRPNRFGTKTAEFVDAPVHGRRTTIVVRRQRYRCRIPVGCRSTFMQPLADDPSGCERQPARLGPQGGVESALAINP